MPQDQPHGVQRPGSGSICPYGKAYYFHCLAVLNDNKMQKGLVSFIIILNCLQSINSIIAGILPTPRGR